MGAPGYTGLSVIQTRLGKKDCPALQTLQVLVITMNFENSRASSLLVEVIHVLRDDTGKQPGLFQPGQG